MTAMDDKCQFVCGHQCRQLGGDQLKSWAAMDFAMKPPEVTSGQKYGRMYADPGSEPRLATFLRTSAAFASLIVGLDTLSSPDKTVLRAATTNGRVKPTIPGRYQDPSRDFAGRCTSHP
jgi:hypothetical protein